MYLIEAIITSVIVTVLIGFLLNNINYIKEFADVLLSIYNGVNDGKITTSQFLGIIFPIILIINLMIVSFKIVMNIDRETYDKKKKKN